MTLTSYQYPSNECQTTKIMTNTDGYYFKSLYIIYIYISFYPEIKAMKNVVHDLNIKCH